MRARARWSFVAAFALACASAPASACFLDWDLPAGGDGGDETPPDRNGGIPDGGPEATLDEPPPLPSPCLGTKGCGPNEYCRVPSHSCGNGTCAHLPACGDAGRNAPGTYWCGCDNTSYMDECSVYY